MCKLPYITRKYRLSSNGHNTLRVQSKAGTVVLDKGKHSSKVKAIT